MEMYSKSEVKTRHLTSMRYVNPIFSGVTTSINLTKRPTVDRVNISLSRLDM